MPTGVVVRIERANGYGFIQTQDRQEVFFHQRWLRDVEFRDLMVGTIVAFDVDRGKRGLRAVNIRLAAEEI